MGNIWNIKNSTAFQMANDFGEKGDRALYSMNKSGLDMEYTAIATTGNSVDFGDLSVARVPPGTGNFTRAICGGAGPSGATAITMDYRLFSSLGTFADFGDLNVNFNYGAACGGTTRGFFFNGNDSPNSTDIINIDFITMHSTGNATDFGDLTAQRSHGSGFASPTRAFCTPSKDGSWSNLINII